jgi:hypothetical protein
MIASPCRGASHDTGQATRPFRNLKIKGLKILSWYRLGLYRLAAVDFGHPLVLWGRLWPSRG